jgi:hypothetical protein
MSDESTQKPTVGYKELLKRYQEAAAKKAKPKVDSLSSDPVDQKTKRGMGDIKTVLIKDGADMKNTLIKWTIIILIAACVFYLVCPKYSFRFPESSMLLWKANKITGTVEVFNRKKSQWYKR